MIKRCAFFIALSLCPLLLSGCSYVQNSYQRPTYTTTDSYGSVFQNERVPQNVR